MPRIILSGLIVATLGLTGCMTVPKTMEPVGGSRSDGTVDLSYDYAEFEKPVVDNEQARDAAKARCKAWGYKDAEPFGGSRSVCQLPGGLSGCIHTLVTVKFQCLGNLK